MKPLRRVYSMSDAALSHVTSRVLKAGTRDLAQLAEQGVDGVFMTRVKNKQTEFNNCQTDEEMMGGIKTATQNRDELKKKTLEKLHQGVMKAMFYYGEEGPNYTSYALGAISHDTHAVIVRKVTRALRLFTAQQPDLVGEGMTPQFVQDFTTLAKDYTNAVDEQVDAMLARNAMMRERTKLGNELYKLLYILAEKGKICWMFSNEALYNDYIIYPKGSTGGQTIDSFIPAQSVVSHEMADVKPGTKIMITNKGTNDLRVFFAHQPTDSSGSSFVVIKALSKLTNIASAMGYNEAANCVNLNVFNTGVVQGIYEVHWK